jgi:hypothetical protein
VLNNKVFLACAAVAVPPAVQLFMVALSKSAFASSNAVGLVAAVSGALTGSLILTRLQPRHAVLLFALSFPVYLACLWGLSLYFVGYVYGDWL